ncbi:MAG: right-handed parallel beta-helix repeat-containing protein [Phycisphaeraceae bacterium]
MLANLNVFGLNREAFSLGRLGAALFVLVAMVGFGQSATAADNPGTTGSETAFGADFVDLGETYRQGSGQAVALQLTREPVEGEDILVLAWSDAEKRVVKEFTFPIKAAPWEIPAEKLDLLPLGDTNLQLLIRENGKKRAKVRQNVEILKAIVPFDIGFADTPSRYTLGSGQSIALKATGDRLEGQDVLVQAWSDAQGKLVDGFAFSLKTSPWTIPASKLDLLPEGTVELQLLKRGNGVKKYTHRMSVSLPTPGVSMTPTVSFVEGQSDAIEVTLSGPAPSGSVLVAKAYSAANGQEASFFSHRLDLDAPKLDPAKLNALPVGECDIVVQLIRDADLLSQTKQRVTIKPVPAPAPVVEEPANEPAADATASFLDQPGQYVTGSGAAIEFDVQNLPEGGDVLIIAWSDAQGSLVSGFGHSLKSAPWRIAASKLDLLPAGTNELQLIIRGGDKRIKTIHRLAVPGFASNPVVPDGGGEVVQPSPETSGDADPSVDPTTDPTTDPATEPNNETDPADEPAVIDEPSEEPQPNTPPQTDPVTTPEFTGSAVGFTKLVKHPETRVIYVSHSRGNDNNDGLSEARPVKTLKRGMALVRDGKPDWLLLKAGDVWEGQSLSNLRQSGGGIDEPFVVGAYGQGPRPMIIPPPDSHGIQLTGTKVNSVLIQGIHVYGATRDPHSPKFVHRDGQWDGINVRLNSRDDQYMKNIIIEDCVVTHFDTNIEVVDDWPRVNVKDENGQPKAGVPGRIKVTIRRNIVRFATGTDHHSIGVYLEGTHDSLIEQNVLDHNGWTFASDRNKRSHNVYCQTINGPITARDNIISRAGAHGMQLRAGGNIEHNLFVQNSLAFFMSLADSKANYNVVLESIDIDPDVPENWRGMGVQGWGIKNFEVIGNVVARRLGKLHRPGFELHASRSLTIKNNRIYDWKDSNSPYSIKIDSSPNVIASGNISQETFGGKEPPFVDPMRSVGQYAGKIGLEPTLEAFLDAAADRPRGVWVEDLAPESVCRYIRNGFDLIPFD